ncbi:MAG: hypothetical protein OXC30_06775, partial [Alphaproteobacteria bacterium]|nr:hypothetical protein [Alphaproteobacteria bacterium]
MHILIFSLFMLFVKTGDASVEDHKKRAFLTGEAAEINYSILQSKLQNCDVVFEKSLMLQVCYALSRSECFQAKHPRLPMLKTDMKVDIDIILYTLRKASEEDDDTLAETFFEQDHKVRKGQEVMIAALNQCVPEVKASDLQEILDLFPQMYDRDFAMSSIQNRYKKKDSKRFSQSLREVVWGMHLAYKGEGPQPDTNTAQQLAWLRGESAKRYYGTLQFNLEREHLKVENSVMLRVCDALSQSDFFHQANDWLKADIDIILYLLSQASSSDTKKLAETFCEEDDKILKKETTILAAFCQSVPDVQLYDIQESLYCIPNQCYQRALTIRSIERRWRSASEDLVQRFSDELKEVLWGWKMCLESDAQPLQPLQQCPSPMKSDVMSSKSDHQDPESTHQGRPSDAGAVSSASDEERPWFKRKPAQEHCGMLEAQLRQKAMTVENSSMLFLCRELSRHDCDLDTNFLVRTDIKTVLYLLCQKSLCQKIEMPS